MKNVFIKILWLSRILTIILFLMSLSLESNLVTTLFITSLTTWYQLEMRNIIGNYVGPLIKINSNSKWFRQSKLEMKIDKLLKVKKWKKHMPAYNQEEFNVKKYSFSQIIYHMQRAEIDHELMFILSYLPISFSLFFGKTGIFIITSFLVSIIDLILVVIQRYNHNRLTVILLKRKNKEGKRRR